MFQQLYSRSQISRSLIPRTDWRPYPRAVERPPWEALPEAVRTDFRKAGAKAAESAWPALPATCFLEFTRNGNRSHYESLLFTRRRILSSLVLAFCVDPKSSLIDPIINAVWSICEESYWGVPAHLAIQAAGFGLPDTGEPTVDLFAAETGALLAWCDYLLGPELERASPLLRARIEREVDLRILEPCLNRDDFWWMGFDPKRLKRPNNWNPWINSNWLACALLLVDDSERRLEHGLKIMRSLDQFIDSYPADGGCDEGPGYWGRAAGSLFDCLELFSSASGHFIDLYRQPLIAEMGRFIYRMHIDQQWFVNFGDASPLGNPDTALVFNYGERIEDPKMQAFAVYMELLSKNSGQLAKGSIGRSLQALFRLEKRRAKAASPPLLRDVWLPDTQIMTARCSADDHGQGLFLAAKGGHNQESHNHNDVGNFILFSHGRPLLIDVGVETYCRQTFSQDRYQIWTMQSGYHNLPVVNGCGQNHGPEYKATNLSYEMNDQVAAFSLDLTAAYPAQAGLAKLERSLRLNRKNHFELIDNWQLSSAENHLFLSLITPAYVDREGDEELILQARKFSSERIGGSGRIILPANLFEVEIETIQLTDRKLAEVWGEELKRIKLKVIDCPARGSYRIMITAAATA